MSCWACTSIARGREGSAAANAMSPGAKRSTDEENRGACGRAFQRASPAASAAIVLLKNTGTPARAQARATSTARGVRGVATSGWRGRSFSFGIADAVTVLARTGAEADAAATIVANAVNLPGHPAVTRQPAHDLAPDSDLGGRLVTTGVGGLSSAEIAEALERGLGVAGDLRRCGLIEAAALFLAGQSRICGHMQVDEAAFAPPYPAEHPTRKIRERPHA